MNKDECEETCLACEAETIERQQILDDISVSMKGMIASLIILDETMEHTNAQLDALNEALKMKSHGYQAAIAYVNTYNLTRNKAQAWQVVKTTLNKLEIPYEEISEYSIDINNPEETSIFNNTIRDHGLKLPADE